jgi:hypothetical protein
MAGSIPPNLPNLGPPPPGPHVYDHSGSEATPCTRCGHRDRSHPDSTSCSARGRWLRRCQCTGYIGFDADDPLRA